MATTSKSLFCLHRIRNLGMLRWFLTRIFRLLGHFRNLNLSLDKFHRWKEICIVWNEVVNVIVYNCYNFFNNFSQYFYRSDPLKSIFSSIVPHYKKLFKFLTIVNQSWTCLIKNFASDGLIPICWKVKLQKYLIANVQCIFVCRKSLFPLYHTLCNNTHLFYLIPIPKHCRK